MTFSFHALLQFSSQSITPLSLTRQHLSASDFMSWRTYLSDEREAIQLKLYKMMLSNTSITEKRCFMTATQQQLVTLSDLVNRHLYRERKIWASHPLAGSIRSHYLLTLSHIQELLSFMRSNFNPYYDNTVKFTQYELRGIVCA